MIFLPKKTVKLVSSDRLSTHFAKVDSGRKRKGGEGVGAEGGRTLQRGPQPLWSGMQLCVPYLLLPFPLASPITSHTHTSTTSTTQVCMCPEQTSTAHPSTHSHHQAPSIVTISPWCLMHIVLFVFQTFFRIYAFRSLQVGSYG